LLLRETGYISSGNLLAFDIISSKVHKIEILVLAEVVLPEVVLASVLLKFFTMEYQVKVEYTGTQGDQVRNGEVS